MPTHALRAPKRTSRLTEPGESLEATPGASARQCGMGVKWCSEAEMASEGDSDDERESEDGAPVNTEVTRARTSLTVAQRVTHIVGMMERLEWERGRSAIGLADKWGLSVKTVEGHAAEAHRLVTADKDEAIRDITAGARSLMRSMLQAEDARGFSAVANLLADVAGAKAPTKQEIDARVTECASPAEAARLVREQFGEKASKAVDDDEGSASSVSEATEG